MGRIPHDCGVIAIRDDQSGFARQEPLLLQQADQRPRHRPEEAVAIFQIIGPLGIAGQVGLADLDLDDRQRPFRVDGMDALLGAGAKVDRPNRLGETALIMAVQQKQVAAVRRLLEAGANPDKTDNASGRSARDYAKLDTRSTEMIRLIEQTKSKKPAAVAGPKL